MQRSERFFTPRNVDFNKQSEKTLAKPGNKFSPCAGNKDGGSNSLGPYHYRNVKKHKFSMYYIGKHWPEIEYFCMEILQLLGINTPKARSIDGALKSSKYAQYVPGESYCATRAIEGYLPNFYLLRNYTDFPKTDPRQRYHLNIKTQLIHDDVTGDDLKISGNYFAAYIGAILIQDTDFQEKSKNFGVILIGKRFYSMAIDKDLGKFSHNKTYSLMWHKSDFFDSAEKDQQLAVLYRIKQALEITSNNECDFDRIFNHPRVLNTTSLLKDREASRDNLKYRAQSMVDHVTRKDANAFKDFERRERFRNRIAKYVLCRLDTSHMTDTTQLKEIIAEDLRAPYYKHLFENKESISLDDCSNANLIDAIKDNLIKEFGLSDKHSYTPSHTISRK